MGKASARRPCPMDHIRQEAEMKHFAVELDSTELRGIPAMPLIFRVVLGGDRDPFAGVVRVDAMAYYTIEQVAKVLHVRQSKVRALARRPEDPIPFAVVDSCSVPLVSRGELLEWVERNSVPLAEAKQS